MGISEPPIRRSISTTLLAAGLLMIGVVCFPMLPIAPLPQVDFPTIQVSATLPGASAETMAASVTTPLERQFSLIAGVTKLTSTSSLSSSSITVQFNLDRDTSLPLTQVDDSAGNDLAQQLSQISGVAQITGNGQQKPAVRIQLDPARIAWLGLGLEDVRAQIVIATAEAPKGTLDGPQQSYAVYDNGQILAAAPWNDIIVAYRRDRQKPGGGRPVVREADWAARSECGEI